FSSSSCVYVPSPGVPSFPYFKLATVDEGKVVLTDYIDASVGIQAIQFERRRALDGAFEIITTVPVNGDLTTFVDETAEIQDYSIEYRTKFIDSCGGFSPSYANINRTIHVSGMANEYDLINTIQWNRYEGFNAGVDHYLVYRSFNGTFTGPPIAMIPNGDDNQEIYSYTDDINNLVSNTRSNSISDYANGAMCYRIVAMEKAGNFFGFQDSSQSNDLCLNYVPLVFIPNAFTPEALNPIFIPVITNVSEKNYSFEIFNRWGTPFFKTNDILKGWDGKVESTGEYAGNDTYIYFIEFEDQDGKSYSKKGIVTLIR
ncbi:MAG: gliding motility-associated C-terminal domain-containing protein, partial [Crocinitomicaceae bacterium]